MRVYATVAWLGLRKQATYALATIAGAFTNTVFGFVRAAVLIALWQARPGLAGYDVGDAITFCFLSQAMIAPVRTLSGGIPELAERIRTGDVAIDLSRPAGLQAWWFALDLGQAGHGTLFRSLPPLAAGALVFGLNTPADLATGVLFAVSIALATLTSFGVRYLVALGTFWLMDDRGLVNISTLAAMFCSGMLLPLNIFPGTLGEVVRLLPWAATVQVPIDVYLGTTGGVAGALAFQAFWAVALLLAGRLLTGVAERRVVVQGG
ncbi:MAG: ABC transporter permease [Streptosporangiales bacterium]|nr:ABC transporter permease [Streptosporangiales bacterium]